MAHLLTGFTKVLILAYILTWMLAADWMMDQHVILWQMIWR